jgi:hypothetical protein
MCKGKNLYVLSDEKREDFSRMAVLMGYGCPLETLPFEGFPFYI